MKYFLFIILWGVIFVTGAFAPLQIQSKGLLSENAGISDLPNEIELLLKEKAVKFNCRIIVQVVDPKGNTYNFGYDGRDQLPITNFDNEYIDIGSCTKMFTASSIIQLIEDGKLKLTDKLTDIFPDESILRGMLVIDGVDFIDSVSIRNLLNHTSGIQDYFGSNDSVEIVIHSDSSLRFTPWDLILLAKGLNKANFIPGKGFAYSNSNYILLGLIIEKVTGMKYTEYIQKNILQTLNMEHTFLPSVFSLPGRKDGHYNKMRTEMPATLAWSAGEIVATPGDLNKFIRGWYSGKLFSNVMCQEIRSKYFDNAPSNYEFGLGVIKGPEQCYGHAGQSFGFESYIGHTSNGYSFVIGVDDAIVSSFELQSIIVPALLSANE